MRHLLYLILFFALLSFSTKAQDLILKTNGEEISCKVLEITPELVKFKKTSITDGPIFSILTTDLKMITFSDGNVEKFNNSNEKEPDYFIDKRDNKSYKLVKIGNQIWFAENLAFEAENSWCYKKKNEFCEKYGRLYTYESALTSCPEGWHLPSDEEWQTLEVKLGMVEGVNEFGWRGTTPGQGKLLKKGGGSGFEAEFAGYRIENSFWDIYSAAYFWTSSKYNQFNGYSWIRFLNERASIKREYKINDAALSVRCIKD